MCRVILGLVKRFTVGTGHPDYAEARGAGKVDEVADHLELGGNGEGITEQAAPKADIGHYATSLFLLYSGRLAAF